MKKSIALLMLAVLLGSCMTIGRIQRNCDKFATICVRDVEKVVEYRDTTIFRTDTIRVPLPYRDTVKITDTVRIVDNLAYLPTVYKRFGIIGVDAGVNRSVLNVNAYLTDSTLLYNHNDTIILEKVIKETGVTKTVTLKHVPGFYKFLLGLFIAELIALIVCFVKFAKDMRI